MVQGDIGRASMYGCVDDELIIELAKRYQIAAPADLADEYEEELVV